ncbi:rhomboid family intramembrane serine protease [Thalassobium sp. R2A62]|uniref:rhomboid family intramembrane serine protease n=1 Tax=Thalassobium sp. R2A62 TaxID=633131 RepID=UPI0001B1D705|nr:rhomboid family intramembrane serine protease [Thalassobium sp. R2A62]EET49312.1 rhomboid family protein [Thalassobium sp. R2A62]
MFPVRDHNPSRRTPYVTYALLALNILIFLSYWGVMQDPARINPIFWNWAMIPAQITAGDNYISLVTSTFLHGGFMHLAGNMLFLWIFGDNLEDELGHVGFLIFYLFCGILANVAQILPDPSSAVPTVGASGAIAGIMGGYLLMFPKAKVDILIIFIVFIRIFPIPAWIMLGLWFGLQIVSGVSVDTTNGGVAYWAHAGGFVIGILYLLPIWLRRGGRQWWDRTEGHPPHPDATYSPSTIPIIPRRK